MALAWLGAVGLDGLPGFYFQILVYRVNTQLLGGGEDAGNAMLLQLFDDESFFENEFFSDRFGVQDLNVLDRRRGGQLQFRVFKENDQQQVISGDGPDIG